MTHFEPKNTVCDAAVPLGERAAGMTLCDFLNPAVPLGKRVRHDLGVTFAGACN